ncbi:MAG: diphosphomevalonate decarboxylase [Sandaracinaceae bacterium]|nr:diphosphomevalonate decarboxylase [Sandaracinaceae bacterium]
MSGRATVVARANIALAKYWGKSDEALNLPAVPSVSMTLAPMRTETTVTLEPSLDHDVFELDGARASDKESVRVSTMLAEIRAEAHDKTHARVASRNFFPTASGLASSASGFAALAAAARAAYGLPRDDRRASILARRASASAARSIFGGFVELPAGTPGDDSLAAYPLFGPDHWDLRLVVAVITEGRKDVSSRDGMGISRRTSPYYEAWVEKSPLIAARIREGLSKQDLAMLGEATEQSFTAMHALAFASSPFTLYFQPGSLAALGTVRRLRDVEGVGVYATMDAGPHVKALCRAKDVEHVAATLGQTQGVLRTIVADPGPGIELA